MANKNIKIQQNNGEGYDTLFPHTLGGIVELTGYTKPASTSAVSDEDSVNAAIGKLEKGLDGKVDDSSVVTTLGPDNTTIPTSKAVADAISGAGGGDMLKSTYDPLNTGENVYNADNHIDGTTNKVFTATEKTKLGTVDENANAYTHPTGDGNKHIPTGGASGQILKYSASGTAVWGDASATSPDHEYGSITYTDSIAVGATLTKTIAISSGKKSGSAIVQDLAAGPGVFISFSANNLATKSVGYASASNNLHGNAGSRSAMGYVTAGGSYSGQNMVGYSCTGSGNIQIDEFYINGSNIEIVFRNKAGSAQTLNCTIVWEVW